MGEVIKMKYDVISLGELLVDFTDNGKSSQGNNTFEANPGGAPCNVLAMLAKLGHQVGFIGKVGNDIFGQLLKDAIEEVGIYSGYLCMDDKVNTTLAFVKKLENGDRDFSFYRNPGADMMLKKDDVNEEALKQSKIFHFGTLSMTHDGVREATKYAIDIAKNNKSIISFDPNIREPLWDSMDNAREQTLFGMSKCDILKISDNELLWVTGAKDYDEGIEWIRNKYNIPLILLSLGCDGSRAYYSDKDNNLTVARQEAFINPDTVETTGAGDTFMGCVLHYVLMKGLDNLSNDDLVEMLQYANAAASIITTRKGALRVMPESSEIVALINDVDEVVFVK